MEMCVQEYIVSDVVEVKSYIDKHIGIDYEVTRDNDSDYHSSGSVVVFSIEEDEHEDLLQYITDNDLWTKKEG